MRPFRLHEPTTVEEAASALADANGGAALYAGGTELLLAMKSGLLAYDTLINVKSIPGLEAVSADNGSVVIGASATHTAVEHDPLVRERLPLLSEVEHGVANLRVRNVGTLAGNLCFAEPHSDPATLLLVYEAELDIAGPSGSRRIAVGDLQTGSYETSLEPDELLTAVRVPVFPSGMRAAYSKFGYHHRPTLGIAAALAVQDGVVTDARLALGCVSPVARRLSRSGLEPNALDHEGFLARRGLGGMLAKVGRSLKRGLAAVTGRDAPPSLKSTFLTFPAMEREPLPETTLTDAVTGRLRERIAAAESARTVPDPEWVPEPERDPTPATATEAAADRLRERIAGVEKERADAEHERTHERTRSIYPEIEIGH